MPEETPGQSTVSLRIAWIGPVPVEVGGVPGVATQLIGNLGALGHHIDCFYAHTPMALPSSLTDQPEIEAVWAGNRWAWDKWYSKSPTAAFVTSLGARAWAFRRLRKEIAGRHASAPYDIVYQFSNIEVVAVPRFVRRTVPLVIHPQTHLAGELRWYRAEVDLARQCEASWLRRFVVRTVLLLRCAIQRRTIRWAQGVVCISSVFRDELIRDYRVDSERTLVVPNPIDARAYVASTGPAHDPPTILVLGRISVRKGIDQIVQLSHRLADSGAIVALRIAGGHTLWSDYRPLLADANRSNTVYIGAILPEDVSTELESADLLIQASKYEPFGLTVGEALASGVPVVATEAVGAVEGTSRESTQVVRAGDVDALVAAVRSLLQRMETCPQVVRRAARADAERLFAPADIAQRISTFLVLLSSTGNRDTSMGSNASRKT